MLFEKHGGFIDLLTVRAGIVLEAAYDGGACTRLKSFQLKCTHRRPRKTRAYVSGVEVRD